MDSLGVRMVAADRSVALRLGCAAFVAAAIPACSAELKDPLSPLTSAKGSILCFRRDYPAEHLMQHPKQTTRSVLLAFQEQSVLSSQHSAAQLNAEADDLQLIQAES